MEWQHNLDHACMLWFTAFREAHRGLLQPMRDISALGGQTVLSLIVLFAVGLLLALRRRRTAGFVLAAALSGLLITEALKVAVGRQRPPQHDQLTIIHDQARSFPSGHSTLSAVIYLTLALIVTAVVHRHRVRVYIVCASLVLAGLVGLSRLYLGVHYLTDVVGGWVVGLVWALFCRWVEFRWVVRLEGRPPPSAMAHHQPAMAGHASRD